MDKCINGCTIFGIEGLLYAMFSLSLSGLHLSLSLSFSFSRLCCRRQKALTTKFINNISSWIFLGAAKQPKNKNNKNYTMQSPFLRYSLCFAVCIYDNNPTDRSISHDRQSKQIHYFFLKRNPLSGFTFW